MKMLRPLFLCFVLCCCLSAHAKTYYFVGKEDSFYENPENWEPSYPGYQIEQEDMVVMQSNFSFQGFDIEVAGKWMIEWGVSCNSTRQGVKIKTTGILQNEGEVAVKYIFNEGEIFNGLSAIMFADKYVSNGEKEVKNLVAPTYQSLAQAEHNEEIWADASPEVMAVSIKRGEVVPSNVIQSETEPNLALQPSISVEQHARVSKLKLVWLKIKVTLLEMAL